MTAKTKNGGSPGDKSQARRRRQADALRRNLKKRKEQARNQARNRKEQARTPVSASCRQTEPKEGSR